MVIQLALSVALLSPAQSNEFDAGPNPVLAQHPTMNANSIVFEFAGDLWKVARRGGDAVRLTASTAGTASGPMFSPDGTKIAFTAQYDGNIDVFVMPAEGGVPTRLTAHPAPDVAVGWTPDGKSVLFRSAMLSNTDYNRLFTVAADGGFPKVLPFPAAESGCFSPDGSRLAYVPNGKWELAWKRYRGGQTTPIVIGDLKDSRVETIPRVENFGGQTNDSCPMWVGDSIYYLSDPTGPVGLYRFDLKTRRSSVVVAGYGFDLKFASLGTGSLTADRLSLSSVFGTAEDAEFRGSSLKNTTADGRGFTLMGSFGTAEDAEPSRSLLRDLTTEEHGGPRTGLALMSSVSGTAEDAEPRGNSQKGNPAIVYEKLGSVHVLDLASGKDETVPISIHADFSQPRVAMKDLRRAITSVSPSPSGQRLVVCARGWAFTVPAKKGSARLLSEEQGVDRENGTWSPDGKTIAYTQDDLKGERLILKAADTGTEKSFELGGAPAVYSNFNWSPDSTKIAYNDNKLNLWSLDVASGKSTVIDTGIFRSSTNIEGQWSPDSQWLTYAHDLPNFYNVIKVYSFKSGKSTVISKGLANASEPTFDRGGKYLYFLASTDQGFGLDTEDILAIGGANHSRQVYSVLLRKDIAHPFRPESDEVEPPADPKAEPKKPAPKVPFSIELDEIDKRIFHVAMPRANYQSLTAGPENSLFVVSVPPHLTDVDPSGPGTLLKFNFADKKVVPFGEGFRAIQPTADGTKLLVQQGGSWRLIDTAAPAPAPSPPIDFSELMVKVDPRVEWEAMYHQVWRKERILFYDPNLHGIDANVMEKRYEPFLKNIRSRSDLNYLFTDMLGELCIGHMFIAGGDRESAPRVRGGLLGADFSFDFGHYRITRVYDGESWNPNLYSPLGNADVRAKPNEYLLAINGKELTSAMDIYQELEGKAGTRVMVKIGPTPDGKGAREVPVTPIDSEAALRNAAWEEDNRRYIDKMTNGRCGYVLIPDTGQGGWAAFMRYYYAQYDKDAIIIDDRFNHGGFINDFMVNEMEKPLDFFGVTRYGAMFKTPNAAVYGPKVMLINELAGSGGDIFPYVFKQHKTGALIGHRTWGGELTAAGFRLIDGGSVCAPEDAQFDIHTGEFIIENHGVDPDIAVEVDPARWLAGVDTQLEAAVVEIKKQMALHPPVQIKRPRYPDKSKIIGGGR